METRDSGAFNSSTCFLQLTYSADAVPAGPARLVLKRNNPEAWAVEAGAAEVAFYKLISSSPGHPAVTVPCIAASVDAASGDSFVLIQDISETHAPPVTRDQQISIVAGVPPDSASEAVADTLARLHAFWWNRTRRDLEFVPYGFWNRDADRFGQYLRRRETSWQDLRTSESDWIPLRTVDLYDQVFARLPGYWERHLKNRFQTGKNLTLTHGDAYFANFLCPVIPRSAPTYLIDWQSASFDIGAYDLALLLTAFWTSAQRADGGREERILRRYHRGLGESGVEGYSWDDLITDYRHGILYWLLVPLQDRFDGSGPAYWRPKMECLTAAYRDWACEELL